MLLHFGNGGEGKLTPKLSNVRQLEERLTVVVGDAERLKLLGVPAYEKQTNEACGAIIARLTCKLLQDWCCTDQVVNMAFDTTASNTGHLTAACIAIQLSLGRPLLWSGCRHHIDGEEQTALTLQRPGALHKARWMAKLLYSLKLALMEQHIALLPQGTITTRQQVPKIRAFTNFITHIYAKWWLTCEKAVDAAWNDLTLYHRLQAYKAVDEAYKALERHRWYLTGEMLPLALFSSKVPIDDKRALASAILEHKPADLPMHVPQQRFGKPKFPALLPTTSLPDLANTDCWFGMHQLNIDPAFLSLDVKEWATNAAFKKSEINVHAVNVVNDCAERGVKLTSDFVAVARKEQHLQNVLQAVEHDRSQQPNLRRCKRKLIPE
ncbi:uncharacterized protein LOC117544294 [Scomber scombrus]|uniref:Uncharacterized protein LOC117544294 n=1 Tax=Scomber scombrus TaxID=13677 RepID=A0AAV1P3I0_SCOSC